MSNKGNKSTSWTDATTSPYQAIIGLISCLKSGKNAWIEIQKNGEQSFPIKIKNPELDNPFNWTMAYGIPRDEKELSEYHYFNDTEKDLTYNWLAAFSTKEASEAYIKSGELIKGLLNGYGTCTPVRIKDAIKLRNDGYQFDTWITHWKPNDNVPYWIPDNIEKVYVVCFNDEPYNENESLKSASNFLMSLVKS